jgi:hypothetical protein
MCEKGIFQSEIARLRESDSVAHSWGMIAYAPDGMATLSDHSNLLNWARISYMRDNPHFTNTDCTAQLMLLARIALQDSVYNARRTCYGKVRKRKTPTSNGVLEGVIICELQKAQYNQITAYFMTLPARALSALQGEVVRYALKAG